MTALLELTVYFTVWTLIAVVAGAAIRNQEWTKEGRDIGLGNRDNLNEATPMGGRAERAAETLSKLPYFLCRWHWLPTPPGEMQRCYWVRRSPFGLALHMCRFTSQGSSISGVWCG